MAQAPDTFGLVSALSGSQSTFRRRLGTVVSVQTGYTMTVQLAGDTTSVSGVRYLGHYPPKVGSAVWIDTDGADLLCIGAVAGLGGAACAVKIWKAANQSINDTTVTKLTFANSSFDPFAMFDDANDQLVAPFDGIYRISGSIGWAVNGTGSRAAYLQVNGSSAAISRVATAAAVTIFVPVTTTSLLTKGDAVTLAAYQSSGAALNVDATGTLTHLAMEYLGAGS